VRSARALTNPEFIFSPGLTSINGADEELFIQQSLELNGTRAARTGVAEARLRQSRAEALVELRSVVFATKTAYFELVRTREQAALTRDLLNFAETADRLAQRQVELGTRPAIEQTQTGIEVLRARQQVTTAEAQAASTQAALNTQMGRPPQTVIGPLVPLSAAVEPFSEEEAGPKALTARTEIAAAEAIRDALLQEARQARAENRPDLAPQFRAASVVRRFEDYGIGLAITIPLDYGSRRERSRQSEEAARAQADRITATRNQVLQEVEQALVQLRAAETVLGNYQKGLLDQAKRLIDASRIGYEEGKTSVLALLEAQRTYRGVQSEYINAQVAYALARAELERAMGAVPATLLPVSAQAPRRGK
jgi:cobalt-zinc-cadmium efflux system outer membrane protein